MKVAFVVLLIAFLILLTAFINLHSCVHMLVENYKILVGYSRSLEQENSRLNCQVSAFMMALHTPPERILRCPFCIPLSEKIIKMIGDEWYVNLHGKWKWLSKKFLMKNSYLIFKKLYELDYGEDR